MPQNLDRRQFTEAGRGALMYWFVADAAEAAALTLG